ncbi:MAG: DNA damage-inducible protein D [Candidatus Nomurabacteria bacterium]|jgi:DNA-damage-inducible protein D|nr:DNA damage-inducible protein D [Candidatus Nomurabacteria bacterium]
MGEKEIVLFETIKHTNEKGESIWSARELMSYLGYDRWENFEKAILRAMDSFQSSKAKEYLSISEQFRKVTKQLEKKNQHGAYTISVSDYELTYYACSLIAQNGDVSKPEIANAQSYFIIQTFRQEQLDHMTDEERRLYTRQQVTQEDKKLFDAAKAHGVEKYGTFYDAGYLGLYGMRSKEIRQKKQLGKDKVLDRAGATELAANLFRITQTQDKLKNEFEKGNCLGDSASTKTHFDVGQEVRKTIEKIGGTMPEELPPETEHIKTLEKRLHPKQLKGVASKKLKEKN